jgi:hypothetical protein
VQHQQGIAIQTGIDLEQLRARLRKMTDTELRRFGRAPDSCAARERILGSSRGKHLSFSCRRREENGGAGRRSEGISLKCLVAATLL